MDIEDHAELVNKIVEGMSKTFRRDIANIVEKYDTSIASSVATNLGIEMCSIGVSAVPEHAREIVKQLVHEFLEKSMDTSCAEFEVSMIIKRVKEMSQ